MRILIAVMAAFAIAETGVAAAQTTSADAKVKAEASANAGTKAYAHKRKHRATVGRGGIETHDNNASARGSILPGKDRLNSKAYIADH